MAFQYVAHLEYKNATLHYTTAAGDRYELPATYQGAYPGATTDSQSLETDSVAIAIAGTATPQQWSVQALASSHPAMKDLFAAQTGSSPRTLELNFEERILFDGTGATVEIDSSGVATVAKSQGLPAETNSWPSTRRSSPAVRWSTRSSTLTRPGNLLRIASTLRLRPSSR